MFFQVGQSQPGTLSLKFTKYDHVRNVIRLQNSHVPEKDYRTAFTDQYFQDLRTLASNTGNIGDVLMRTCIVITKDGAVARVETSNIMEETHVNVIGSMTPEQKHAIAEKLDKDPVLRTTDDRDDWLGLTERLAAEGTLEAGFAAKMNACVAQGSPTMKLLEMLGRRDPRYPTARLLDHLKQMKRNDAVEAFNHASETKRRKDFQKTRAHTVNLGELAMGLQHTKLSKEESGSDPCLPDSADRLHSDAEGNLAGDKTPSFLSQSCPRGVLQRSNTVPTPPQERQPTSVPVHPVSNTVPTPTQQQPTSVPVQPVSNAVPTPAQVQEQTTVPIQPMNQHTELSSPQQLSQPHDVVSESLTVDLHVTGAPNELQATPEYPMPNDLPDNPGYPEVETAVASSSRTFQNPKPIAVHENPVTSQIGQTQNGEPETNPSYPAVSEAVTGPTASPQLPLETGNSSSSGGTGLVGQTATEANQEYPPVERAVQSN
ncbi:Hypp5285 [Branchiostoma lanceolatum]|nr:Hypp5285 [Branchiostoma lanceolatum]